MNVPVAREEMKIDTILERKIFLGALRGKLDQLKENKEKVVVMYTFEQNGTLAKIVYGLPINTIIFPSEMASIDQHLRSEIKAAFSGRAYLDHPVISRSRTISF